MSTFVVMLEWWGSNKRKFAIRNQNSEPSELSEVDLPNAAGLIVILSN
jgi:hypothetical protein